MRKYILAIFAFSMLIGCKSNTDSVPGILHPGTDVAPKWEYTPSRETFNTMTAIVQIPQMFNSFLTEKDEMVVFSNEGKILAVASPYQEAINQYWLVIEQPKGSQSITVKWYCDKLTRIYTVQTFPDFMVNKMIGEDEPYVLTFIDK